MGCSFIVLDLLNSSANTILCLQIKLKLLSSQYFDSFQYERKPPLFAQYAVAFVQCILLSHDGVFHCRTSTTIYSTIFVEDNHV